MKIVDSEKCEVTDEWTIYRQDQYWIAARLGYGCALFGDLEDAKLYVISKENEYEIRKTETGYEVFGFRNKTFAMFVSYKEASDFVKLKMGHIK